MSALLSSNQYKLFESYAAKCGIKVFVSVQDKEGVVSARGHLNTGQLGVNLIKMQERRNSRNWIPDRPFPKLAEPLSKLKGDDSWPVIWHTSDPTSLGSET